MRCFVNDDIWGVIWNWMNVNCCGVRWIVLIIIKWRGWCDRIEVVFYICYECLMDC